MNWLRWGAFAAESTQSGILMSTLGAVCRRIGDRPCHRIREERVSARVDLRCFLLDSSLLSALFYAHLISAGWLDPVTSPIRST